MGFSLCACVPVCCPADGSDLHGKGPGRNKNDMARYTENLETQPLAKEILKCQQLQPSVQTSSKSRPSALTPPHLTSTSLKTHHSSTETNCKGAETKKLCILTGPGCRWPPWAVTSNRSFQQDLVQKPGAVKQVVFSWLVSLDSASQLKQKNKTKQCELY